MPLGRWVSVEVVMLQVALFGGSNSVLRDAFAHGLAAKANVKNFALGASSSSQNHYAFLCNFAEIRDSDVIVTESNVNDSDAVKQLRCHYSLILKRIDDYYYDLSLAGLPVIVLLIPVRRANSSVEASYIVEAVNNRHRENAIKYGFYTVDMPRHWEGVPPGDLETLLPDIRHPTHPIMYQLGVNLIDCMLPRLGIGARKRQTEQAPSTRCIAARASEFGVDYVFERRNSAFREDVRDVRKFPLQFSQEFWGSKLVGVGSWCEENAILCIRGGGGGDVYKPLNRLNAFNEVISAVTVCENTVLRSDEYEIADITERSISIPKSVSGRGAALLTGFLFERADVVEGVCNAGDGHDISEVIPNHKPYISADIFFSKKPKDLFTSIDPKILYQAALCIRDIDPGLAANLARYSTLFGSSEKEFAKACRDFLREVGG